MEVTDAFEFINHIDNTMASHHPSQAIPSDVFTILDDPNASRQAIETIGSKINEEICLRLTAMASSIYLGTLRRGDIASFYDVVACLGMERTKALIIMFHNYVQGKQYPEIEVIFAQSYATSIMSMIIASQVGFREDAVKRAELCGLYMDIGRKIMTLYKILHVDDAKRLTEDFINTYHAYLGEKIVLRYSLPEYIQKVIIARNLILEENHISLAGVVHLAHEMVQNSFVRYHNRLVLKCQIPRPATDVTRTLEAIIMEKFKAIGLENYLHIIKIPRMYDLQ